MSVPFSLFLHLFLCQYMNSVSLVMTRLAYFHLHTQNYAMLERVTIRAFIWLQSKYLIFLKVA